MGEAVALGSHDEGQSWLGFELRRIERYGVVGERHCHRLETKVAQSRQVVDPRPGHEEHAAHRHADGAAVERVARVLGQQDGIDAESRCRAEDSADVGGVAYAVDDDDASRSLAYFGHAPGQRTPHSAEHTPRQRVAGELSQQLPVACVDGHFGTASDDVGSVARDVPALTEQGLGLHACVEGHTDDLRAFGYEHTLLGHGPVSQLCFSQRAEHLYARLFE